MRSLRIGKLSVYDCAQLAFCTLFVYCFTHIGISALQTFKDIYFYGACCALMLMTLAIKKARLITWPKIVFTVVCVAGILLYQYIRRNDWGPNYRDMLIARHLMYVVFALVIWDMIENRRIVGLSARNRVFVTVFLAAFIVGLILGKTYIAVILIPMFSWYQTPMDRKEWKKFIDYLSYSIYLVYVFYMTKSFIVMPDGFQSGRYVGIFVFPAIGGVISSLALIAGYHIWTIVKDRVLNKSCRILVLILLLAYPLVGFFMIFNRASALSLAFALLFMFIVSAKDERKKKAAKRGIIVVGIILLLFVGYVVTVKVLQNTDLTAVSEYLEKNSEKPGMYILNRFILTVTIDESRTGIFKAGTLLNAFDTMSSTRLSIYYLGIRNIKLLGGSDLGVVLPNGEEVWHTHNTYLDWLLRLGYVGGTLMIVWFFAQIVLATRRHLEYDKDVTYTVLWSAFCIPFCFIERELFTNLPTFLILMLQYPLLIDFKDRKEKEEKETCNSET